MSMATMWKSTQRYVPQLVYSVSVLLLLKNILVWRNFRYFMASPRSSRYLLPKIWNFRTINPMPSSWCNTTWFSIKDVLSNDKKLWKSSQSVVKFLECENRETIPRYYIGLNINNRVRRLRGNALDSHSGGPGFKSRGRPTWFRFLLVSSISK